MKLMIIGVTLAGFAAFTPLSAQRPSGNQRGSSRQDCTNSQRSVSVSDIILGRSSASTVGCVDNRTNRQVNGGGWYQVGNDGNGGTIYERQTQDRNGNVIIQRARRDRNGNMSIISTRNVGNDGTFNNGRRNNRRNGDDDGDDDDDDDDGNFQNGRWHDNGNHNGHRNHDNSRGHGKNKHHDDDD
ncbi:MAG TPA: hypothetical protein VGQ98_07235 [Gemmatimonadaceae bacterium]|nr:hypothetical protein [Gemmatimonadaceae bacterium]